MISDMLSKHVGAAKSVLKKWFKINNIQLVHLLVVWYLVNLQDARGNNKDNFSDMFPIRNGLKQDDLSPLLSNFPLDYAIRRVQVNQDGLKLNGTHQPFVYADDVKYWVEATIS